MLSDHKHSLLRERNLLRCCEMVGTTALEHDTRGPDILREGEHLYSQSGDYFLSANTSL